MEYNVRFEFDAPGDAERADHLVTSLRQFHPAASRSELGRLEVGITVLAEDVGQAAVLSYQTVYNLVRMRVTAMEILRMEDFDRINGLTPMPELVNAEGAAEILGISAAAVGQKFTAGELPGQRLGKRTLAFSRRDMELIADRRHPIASGHLERAQAELDAGEFRSRPTP
jgi:hypothetical protein